MSDELLLYTDGSAGPDGGSASASILVDRGLGRRLKVSVLGTSPGGPEAELFGGILGLLSVDACGYPRGRKVRWLLDSKAVINRAAQILEGGAPASPHWECWKRLAARASISIEWVKAHDGHRENEACDRACSWIRLRGEEFLRERGEGPIGFAAKKGAGWLFFCARDLSRKLAASEAVEAECESLRGKIAAYAGELHLSCGEK